MTSSFTPPPWDLDNRNSKAKISAKGFEIANVKKLHHCYDECVANAGLIAAAPDLLEACEQVKSYLEELHAAGYDDPNNPVFIKLIAAIDRAEGSAA